jgi:hypothetical protein
MLCFLLMLLTSEGGLLGDSPAAAATLGMLIGCRGDKALKPRGLRDGDEPDPPRVEGGAASLCRDGEMSILLVDENGLLGDMGTVWCSSTGCWHCREGEQRDGDIGAVGVQVYISGGGRANGGRGRDSVSGEGDRFDKDKVAAVTGDGVGVSSKGDSGRSSGGGVAAPIGK